MEKEKHMLARKVLVAGLLALGAAGLAYAGSGKGGDDERIVKREVHRGFGHASVEFAAMHNIMAELLSAKTGKTQAEIASMFDAGGPHAVADKLGLKKEDMRALMKEARGTLITRAAAANLITADQAEKLRAAKVEMRHKQKVHVEEGDDD
jgi:hypothetical protein